MTVYCTFTCIVKVFATARRICKQCSAVHRILVNNATATIADNLLMLFYLLMRYTICTGPHALTAAVEQQQLKARCKALTCAATALRQPGITPLSYNSTTSTTADSSSDSSGSMLQQILVTALQAVTEVQTAEVTRCCDANTVVAVTALALHALAIAAVHRHTHTSALQQQAQQQQHEVYTVDTSSSSSSCDNFEMCVAVLCDNALTLLQLISTTEQQSTSSITAAYEVVACDWLSYLQYYTRHQQSAAAATPTGDSTGVSMQCAQSEWYAVLQQRLSTSSTICSIDFLELEITGTSIMRLQLTCVVLVCSPMPCSSAHYA
jgi:hypothetical protein